MGLRNVGSYQTSGHPWVTGSTELGTARCHMVEFPYVTKSFTVINVNTNSGEDIRVHFQSGSGTDEITIPGHVGEKAISDGSDVYVGLHYITVPPGNSSITFDVKCKRAYISNPDGGTDNLDYQVFAELTNIPTQSMYHIPGSGVTDRG